MNFRNNDGSTPRIKHEGMLEEQQQHQQGMWVQEGDSMPAQFQAQQQQMYPQATMHLMQQQQQTGIYPGRHAQLHPQPQQQDGMMGAAGGPGAMVLGPTVPPSPLLPWVPQHLQNQQPQAEEAMAGIPAVGMVVLGPPGNPAPWHMLQPQQQQPACMVGVPAAAGMAVMGPPGQPSPWLLAGPQVQPPQQQLLQQQQQQQQPAWMMGAPGAAGMGMLGPAAQVPAAPPAPVLGPEQQTAVDLVHKGHCIFLTGERTGPLHKCIV